MNRVAKTIGLMDIIDKINDPQSELLLLLSCTGISLFFVSKPCSACSRVFAGDIYGDHVVSCVVIIGIKHRHNVVHDTLVDICYRSGISAVSIWLSVRLLDMGFFPFFSLLWGELEADAVTLLKRIRKFSMNQDIRERAAAHIFNRISFAIAKGLLAYCLITETEVGIGEIIYSDLVTKILNKSRFLPDILSNSNFTKDPSKVSNIELTAHVIDVNNHRDSVSPLPFSAKKKKVKSETVTPTLPKSQGLEASESLPQKRKKP
ncbi:hypothetical protein Tco_0245376 [Tanacetum coccineum]